MVHTNPPATMGGPPAPVLVCHSTVALLGAAVATATIPDSHGSYTVVPETAVPPSTSPLQNELIVCELSADAAEVRLRQEVPGMGLARREDEPVGRHRGPGEVEKSRSLPLSLYQVGRGEGLDDAAATATAR